MKKVLKWAGIAIGGIIVLVIFIGLSGKLLNSGNGSFTKKNSGSEMGLPQVVSPLRGSSDAPKSFGLPLSEDSLVADSSEFQMEEATVGVESINDISTVDQIPLTEKKIIKSGDLYLKVSSAEKAVDEISQIAQNNQGEIFSSNLSRTSSSGIKSGYVTVKVPFKNFEKTFGELKKVASLVLSESISGQDVTDQYTDLQSRLKNKQSEEVAYLKILDQSGKMDDILAVTRALSNVREEIEILQGRIRLMESQTDMSTIQINLTEDAEITAIDTWRPWQVIKTSINQLIKNLQGFFNFIIRFIIQALPVLALYGLIIWAIFRIGRKIFEKAKNKKKNETESNL